MWLLTHCPRNKGTDLPIQQSSACVVSHRPQFYISLAVAQLGVLILKLPPSNAVSIGETKVLCLELPLLLFRCCKQVYACSSTPCSSYHILPNQYKFKKYWTGESAQWVKVFGTIPGGLHSILETYKLEGEN